MGVPVAAAAALARTRTGRRLVIGIVLSVALIATVNVSLLAAVPLAITAQSTADTAAPDTDGPIPAVSGDWGYPLAGAYSKGRGFGYNPVAGCAFCSTDHKGYDMAQGCGATVYAAGDGRVVTAGAFFGVRPRRGGR